MTGFEINIFYLFWSDSKSKIAKKRNIELHFKFKFCKQSTFLCPLG